MGIYMHMHHGHKWELTPWSECSDQGGNCHLSHGHLPINSPALIGWVNLSMKAMLYQCAQKEVVIRHTVLILEPTPLGFGLGLVDPGLSSYRVTLLVRRSCVTKKGYYIWWSTNQRSLLHHASWYLLLMKDSRSSTRTVELVPKTSCQLSKWNRAGEMTPVARKALLGLMIVAVELMC